MILTKPNFLASSPTKTQRNLQFPNRNFVFPNRTSPSTPEVIPTFLLCIFALDTPAACNVSSLATCQIPALSNSKDLLKFHFLWENPPGRVISLSWSPSATLDLSCNIYTIPPSTMVMFALVWAIRLLSLPWLDTHWELGLCLSHLCSPKCPYCTARLLSFQRSATSMSQNRSKWLYVLVGWYLCHLSLLGYLQCYFFLVFIEIITKLLKIALFL